MSTQAERFRVKIRHKYGSWARISLWFEYIVACEGAVVSGIRHSLATIDGHSKLSPY